MIHPNVLDAYEQAVKVLKDHDIPFRASGGTALNLFNAGSAFGLSTNLVRGNVMADEYEFIPRRAAACKNGRP